MSLERNSVSAAQLIPVVIRQKKENQYSVVEEGKFRLLLPCLFQSSVFLSFKALKV
jgi:hypothetical protein